MMRKKGLSIVIGYVLLVVIAISLSLLVYSWMKAQIPKQEAGCPDGLSLIISDYNCGNSTLSLKLKNNGLFNVYGFIIRFIDSEGKTTAIKSREQRIEHFFNVDQSPLKPGEEFSGDFSYSGYDSIKEIEIQPFISEKEVILCDRGVIRQELEEC